MDYDSRARRLPSKEEREARKERDRLDAELAIAERDRAVKAFHANFERLKAERLARTERK